MTAADGEILDEICRDQLEAAAFGEKAPEIDAGDHDAAGAVN